MERGLITTILAASLVSRLTQETRSWGNQWCRDHRHCMPTRLRIPLSLRMSGCTISKPHRYTHLTISLSQCTRQLPSRWLRMLSSSKTCSNSRGRDKLHSRHCKPLTNNWTTCYTLAKQTAIQLLSILVPVRTLTDAETAQWVAHYLLAHCLLRNGNQQVHPRLTQCQSYSKSKQANFKLRRRSNLRG